MAKLGTGVIELDLALRAKTRWKCLVELKYSSEGK